ncbi:hypothetical protein WJX82_009254 [Trebouxia sp. C0006]
MPRIGVDSGPHTVSGACAAEDAAWLLAVSFTSNLVTIISRFAVQVVGLQAAAAAEARHPELELLSKKYALYTRDQQVASCH